MAHTTKNDEYSYRSEAIKALDKLKAKRAGRKFKMVRTGVKTWKEVEVQ